MALIKSIQQIDEAVINAIKAFAIIDSSEVPVVFLNPEEEYSIETYPQIVVYRIGEFRDGKRIFLPYFYDNYQYDGSHILTEVDQRESPLPVNFMYAVRLYYNYHIDGTVLNLALLKRFPHMPKPSYITIDGYDYDFVFWNHRLFQSGKDDFGRIQLKRAEEERIFCDQYMYDFCADLDIFDAETVLVSKTITVRTTDY